MAADDFAIRIVFRPDGACLALVGELDIAGVAALDVAYRRASDIAGEPGVLLDLSALEFCDVAGQRELLRCHTSGAVLTGAPRCLQQLFGLTGHGDMLPKQAEGRWAPTAAASPEAREVAAAISLVTGTALA